MCSMIKTVEAVQFLLVCVKSVSMIDWTGIMPHCAPCSGVPLMSYFVFSYYDSIHATVLCCLGLLHEVKNKSNTPKGTVWTVAVDTERSLGFTLTCIESTQGPPLVVW